MLSLSSWCKAWLVLAIVVVNVEPQATQPIPSTVRFSTFAGGQKNETANSVVIDRDGNIYVAGRTFSTNFPVLAALQPNLERNEDCFVLKLDRLGKPVFSTYFGGSGDDGASCIRLDGEGNIYIVGFSHSTDLPTTPGAFQEDYQGGTAFGNGDGFIAKFSNDGSKLLFCSYFGSNGDDFVTHLQINPNGDILLGGVTDSAKLPGGSVTGARGKQDAFVAKLDSAGGRVLWSKIIAGSADEENVVVAEGRDAVIYFSGATYSTNFPVTANAVNKTNAPAWESRDGFFGVLEPDGSALRYLSYFGSPADEAIFDFALTKDGAAIITGINGSWLTATNGVFQAMPGFGPNDAFVARLRPGTWEPEWESYLGGTESDYGFALALDSAENIYVAGLTDSTDFPLKDSLAKYGGGDGDGFLVKISADGSKLEHSSFIGGTGEEWVLDVALNPDGEPVLVGFTGSENFPVHHAFLSKYQGSVRFDEMDDAFITSVHAGPASPLLKVARSGGSIVVSWPQEAEDFVVESTSSPESSGWLRVSGTPVVVGGHKTLVLRAEQKAQFLRLIRP